MGLRVSEEDSLPVFVINLASRPDRWRIQRLQSKLHRLSVERISAYNGTEGRARFPDAEMSDGAAGLWRTFERLCADLHDRQVPVAVILEDDAILTFRFKQKVIRIMEHLPDEVALVQLGFLKDSSWRPQNSVWRSIRRVLRPRSRVRAMVHAARGDNRTKRGLGAGTHALLVFPARLYPYVQKLVPDAAGGQPLDRAFLQASKEHPHIFIRSKRSLASQLPVRSDIPWRHAK